MTAAPFPMPAACNTLMKPVKTRFLKGIRGDVPQKELKEETMEEKKKRKTEDRKVEAETTPAQISLPRAIHLVPMDRLAGFDVRPGFYEINGATAIPGGVNFTVYSHGATSIELLLFHRMDANFITFMASSFSRFI